ncbi:helix-turn-helix domain-containing protein [Paraburkholderia sp. HD33-4]|uniref:helix-turn-helix domain-containing protein n=1 Tax=Paraburkholderia sp. HD33-4 TaxID=2883242 RepID=UPI001F1C01F2|nr:helix-turn-helix domain-containing protein [Paraburkholderia sp. HD33-4]
MYYGLDMSEVRYETDHAGNKLKATIPYPMFSALVEFWREARRAQTASLETQTRPGQFKTSLAAAAVEPTTSPAEPPPRTRPSQWDKLCAALPPEPLAPPEVSPAPADPTPSPAASPTDPNRITGHKTKQVIFVREFAAPVPEEVAEQVRRGVYFLRAWRVYRKLTMHDVADLFSKSKATVNWHENGYSTPTPKTLARFAEILDCSVAQLTAKPGSNTQPWLRVIEQSNTPPADSAKPEVNAPEGTEYPKAVLAHIIGGKSPLTAWRIHRELTVAQLADAYGCSNDNIRKMEERDTTLRARTLEKLAAALHCKPAQLLRPAGMPEANVRVPVRGAQPEEVLRRARSAEARAA